MDNDWASDGEEEGFGDISALPTVEAPEPPPEPEKPASPPPPPVNAWTSPNQSGDVRAATRMRHAGSSPTPHRSMGRRDAMPFPQDNRLRAPSDIRGRPQSAPGFSSPRQAAPMPTTTLYVSNLPFDTSEIAIASFFSRCGVTPADVRITRHSDTGNIKAAFVTVRDIHRADALAMDGRLLASRSVHVKVDGEDRRQGGRDGTRSGGSRDRERPGYGFGNRDRRDLGDAHRDRMDRHNGGGRETGWSTGQWVDRPGSVDNRNSNVGREGRTGSAVRDGRSAGVRGDLPEREQRSDPTIPTGPTPAGRKKLMLKPRTKPLPVLEVDKRAIDGHRPLSAPAAMPNTSNSQTEGGGVKPESGEAITRKGSGGRLERWVNPREESAPRSPSTQQSVNKKDEDSKRPVLLNTFAALEVNDADV